MYSRSQSSRQNRGVNIPFNYSGNAFSKDIPQTKIHKPTQSINNLHKKIPQEEENYYEENIDSADYYEDEPQEKPTHKEDTPVSVKEKKSSSELFSSIGNIFGGIGSEELLLIALLFLISQGEKNDELSLMLLLLLFIR